MTERKDESCTPANLLMPRHSFHSLAEYEQFCLALASSRDFVRVAGTTDISEVGLREQLYEHHPTKTLWRLVKVDFPCRGSWRQISSNDVSG